ncbi:MAG: DNA repair protein RecO [Pseudomonadota bacterium]
MQWHDDALVLGTRRHGESGVVLEVLTRHHGRHLGLVRSGRSRRMQPVLQPGNAVEVTWRARLDEHLGQFSVEPVTLRAAALMESPLATSGVQLFASLIRLLPERDPHETFFVAGEVILGSLPDPALSGELMIRLELELLNNLGFGLDLSACAATGSRESLVYVSPKSGRAVSRDAGEPYRSRLLSLPGFLVDRAQTGSPDLQDLEKAFELSGFFLMRSVYEPRGQQVPSDRAQFLKALRRAFEQGAG